MNWTALNAVAQVVAALGVIVTLFYLAAQIRQNTRAVRRAAYQDLLNYITEVNMKLTEDRSLCELSVRARDGLGDIDDADRMRLLVWFGTVFRHYQNAHDLFSDGVITDEQWQNMLMPLGRQLETRGGREMWQIVRGSFHADFKAVVDQRVAVLAAAAENDSSA